jgi:hypothetical protein
MKKIPDLIHEPLKWQKVKKSSLEYTLVSGEVEVARLRYRKHFGTLATAESGDGCWTFKRVGFWQNKASIRACNAEDDLAVFKNDTWSSGGTLAFASGSQFNATTNFWMTRLEFQTPQGEVLVRFHHKGVFSMTAEVEITPQAGSLPELPLLVLFGWYLLIMLYNDSTSVVVATTVLP